MKNFKQTKDKDSLIKTNNEYTTQQAADLLEVSRVYLIKLLEEGKIPFRKVGTRRRIKVFDVIAHKEFLKNQSRNQLTFLMRQAQELKIGYQK